MNETNVAIITGGGQGIGKAIAKRLLQESVIVVIAENDQEAGKETEEEFRKIGDIHFMHTDVAQEDSVKKTVEYTRRRFQRIDVLVNNAGTMNYMDKPIEELALRDWNEVISVNLTGAFLCSKYAVPSLREHKGSIINISSTRAFMSEKNTFAYTASKGGLVSLTHALSVSLGPEIRVNCISPGWIETSEWKKKELRSKAKLTTMDHMQHPAGRVGIPEDIASLAAYLISPEATFVTGANFVVDGGMTRKMIYV
ncbi:MAG: glucose 1-dehydrogenase [bacterium]